MLLTGCMRLSIIYVKNFPLPAFFYLSIKICCVRRFMNGNFLNQKNNKKSQEEAAAKKSQSTGS